MSGPHYVWVSGTQFVVDISLAPPSCLPRDLDTSSLQDVTCVGDLWRKFLDVLTGALHDGAVYAAEAQRLALL